MAENINITAESLTSNLSSFQAEMAKMTALLGEIETATSTIKGKWEGAASEYVLSKVEQFQKVFTDVNAQNEKYVNFMNSVIDKYTTADNSGINSVESHVGSYSI